MSQVNKLTEIRISSDTGSLIIDNSESYSFFTLLTSYSCERKIFLFNLHFSKGKCNLIRSFNNGIDFMIYCEDTGQAVLKQLRPNGMYCINKFINKFKATIQIRNQLIKENIVFTATVHFEYNKDLMSSSITEKFLSDKYSFNFNSKENFDEFEMKILNPTPIKTNKSSQGSSDDLTEKHVYYVDTSLPVCIKNSIKSNDSSSSRVSKKNLSSSTKKDKCPICYENINNLSITKPCKHSFCSDCIIEWSKVSTNCPVCKMYFTMICTDNKIKTLKQKQFYYDPYEDNSQNTEWYDNLINHCMICKGKDKEYLMIVCDSCDKNVAHYFCDGLDRIPTEEWFCPKCRKNKSLKTNSKI